MTPHHRRRYAVLAVAGALHVAVIELILHAPATEDAPAEESTVWSTLILLPAEPARPPPPRKPESKAHTRTAVPAVAPAAPAPSTPTPGTSITVTPDQSGSGPAVDWMAELDKTSRDVAAKQAANSGPAHEAPVGPGSLWPAPIHKAGDQYTLTTGEKIYWVSANCFVISDPPQLGTPNAFAHAQLTHTGCQRPPSPGGNLFKDLPAYKQYHSDAPDSGTAARP